MIALTGANGANLFPMKTLGIRLPEDQIEALTTLAAANACSVSDLARKAIAQFLEAEPEALTQNSLEKRVANLEQALAALTQSQKTVSAALTGVNVQPKAIAKIQSGQALAPVSSVNGRLTTSEAFAELKGRGWQGENTTLRRKLRDGTVPEDLQRLGLLIDPQGFEQRRENPKDNRVKWLYFKH